jgi:phospholipid/cholesterol/gamma-HCH transport system substrate-binding protein
MKNAAARRASLGQLVGGAVILGVVLVACVALTLTWILHTPVTHRPDDVTVSMPRTGGLFEGSAATYRGVRVGQVTKIEIDGTGVVATVRLDNGAEIPKASHAKVRSLSPVGEQYVDFQPEESGGPYLEDGDSIVATADDLPVSLAKAATGLQAVFRQVDPKKVKTVLHELNTGFTGTGPDLHKLLSESQSLLQTFDETWPTTVSMLKNTRGALGIFADNRQLLLHFASTAAQVATWYVGWDPQLRKILERMPTNLTQAILLIEGAKHRLPDLLKGVNQLSKFLAVRTPHLLATLAMVPYGIGRFASVFRSGKAYLTINLNSQPHCQYGTTKGSPMSTDRNSPYLGGHCPTEPWRGAAHAPGPLGS